MPCSIGHESPSEKTEQGLKGKAKKASQRIPSIVDDGKLERRPQSAKSWEGESLAEPKQWRMANSK